MEFRHPREGYHTVTVGTTGSGKSTLAAFLIAKSPFHLRPQFVIDFKGEDIFASLHRIVEIGVYDTLPTQPGLYILRPRPDQQDEVEAWLEKLWNQGNAGLYIDEGYLMPDKKWLRNVLAQGRSLGITVITASQRPIDVPLSIFTEATYFSAFHLSYKKDKQRVEEYTAEGLCERPLQEFHSVWYDRKQHKPGDPAPYVVLSPVPEAATIVDMIDSRLRPRHTLL